MTMTTLVIALVLGAPLHADGDPGRSRGSSVCAVSVLALDPDGRLLSARTASVSRTPAMVFRGWSAPFLEDTPPLVFDVFNPRGQRYQVLLATSGRPFVLRGGTQRLDRPVEARLAVAGSSIAWTSMFGTWRVEPRFEGHDGPCGRPQVFTIQP
jgi:hypothetical protein